MFLNINCKQHSISNIYGLRIFLKIKSASSNVCAKSSNSRWMKVAKIGLPKGSGKRLRVREKSVKSQGILKWILSGNPGCCIPFRRPGFDHRPRSHNNFIFAYLPSLAKNCILQLISHQLTHVSVYVAYVTQVSMLKV